MIKKDTNDKKGKVFTNDKKRIKCSQMIKKG